MSILLAFCAGNRHQIINNITKKMSMSGESEAQDSWYKEANKIIGAEEVEELWSNQLEMKEFIDLCKSNESLRVFTFLWPSPHDAYLFFAKQGKPRLHRCIGHTVQDIAKLKLKE